MKQTIKLNEKQLRQIIRESLENYFGKIKLYHVVTRRRLKEGENAIDLCRSVYRKGLVPFNNGEVGNCIWFWVDKPFYEGDDMIIVSLDYTLENKELFEIYVDKPNAWAHNTIPFDYLNVESAPWVLFSNGNILFYNELDEGENNFYERYFDRHVKSNFERIDKDTFPWTVFVDILPEGLLKLIPKNDERFKFDRLFK